jgi:hypothetical protein
LWTNGSVLAWQAWAATTLPQDPQAQQSSCDLFCRGPILRDHNVPAPEAVDGAAVYKSVNSWLGSLNDKPPRNAVACQAFVREENSVVTDDDRGPAGVLTSTLPRAESCLVAWPTTTQDQVAERRLAVRDAVE